MGPATDKHQAPTHQLKLYVRVKLRLSTYDFSTRYTTLPHNLIKYKRIDLIKRTFNRDGSSYLACNDRNAFFTSEKPKTYHAWSCQKVCKALTFSLDNIFIRFGTRLYNYFGR